MFAIACGPGLVKHVHVAARLDPAPRALRLVVHCSRYGNILLTTRRISCSLFLVWGVCPQQTSVCRVAKQRNRKGKKMDCVCDFIVNLIELLWKTLTDWINDLINPPAEQ